MNDKTSSFQGGCRCGAVRYTLKNRSLPLTYTCHCLDCQTWTGSAFSQQSIVPQESLSVTGPLTEYMLTTPSGNTSRQQVCSLCHTRIFNSNTARPGMFIIRAGTLDNSDELEVAAHIWVKRKQAWLQLSSAVPSWQEAAQSEELFRVLGIKQSEENAAKKAS